MASNINWLAIRSRYESGETSHAISKEMGGRPTRQGIEKRAKREGWYKQGRAVAVGNQDGNLPPTERFQIQADEAECLKAELSDKHNFALQSAQIALGLLREGATHGIAAAACGITLKTWGEWRDASPTLDALGRKAKALHAMENIRHIKNAAPNDWKAADRLLETNELAADAWGKKGGGPQVAVQINTGVPKGDHVKVIDGS